MEKNNKKKGGAKDFFLVLIIILLVGIIIFSGTQIYKIISEYHAADVVKDSLQVYKPVVDKTDFEKDNTTVEVSPLIELNEMYPDVVGWLTIDDTSIDYVFAQGKDNERYLRATLEGNYLVSGTVFLDYRSPRDFSNFNSIIYGHLMNNGTMFADIEKFQKPAYFDSHEKGNLFLMDKTYDLEIFAYMVVDSMDPIIYNPEISGSEFLPYVQQNAINYRDIGVTENDKLVTLSTCSNLSEEARCVLVARLVEAN